MSTRNDLHVRHFRRYHPRHIRMQPYVRPRARLYGRIVELHTNGMLTHEGTPVYVQTVGKDYRHA